MRKLVFVLLLLVFALPASAQDTNGWTAWLFDPLDGTMRLVDQNGAEIETFTLPLAQAFNIYAPNAIVSPSERYIAYLGIDGSAGTLNQQLFVYDRQLAGISAAYALSPDAEATTIDVSLNTSLFDEESNQLAFGYVLNTPNAPGWEVVVLDYFAGLPNAVLNHEDDIAAPVENDLVVPVIQAFDGNTVDFTTVFYAAGGTSIYPAYRWDVAGGTVTPSPIYDSLVNDRAVDGSLISPAYDSRLPEADIPAENDFVIRQNVLRVYNPATGLRFPFYFDAEQTIISAQFVQNSARVIVNRYDAVSNSGALWTLIERDGTVLGDVPISQSVFQVFDTGDGFAYIEIEQGPTLVHVRSADNDIAPRVIWTGEFDSFPTLVHIGYDAPPSESVPAWSQLAEPETIANGG